MFTLNEKQSNILLDKLCLLKGYFVRAQRLLFTITDSDKKWFFIIIFLAGILRLPFVGHIPLTEFDEVYMVSFVLHIIHGQPFFDIHPPLVRMIFATIAGWTPFHFWSMDIIPQQAFGDFPYTMLRYVSAVAGTLLPLVIYAIGRLLNYTPRMAGLAALFIVFDNALVIYSRVFLPDTLLLFFEFLSLMFALASLRTKNKKLSVFFTISAGIFAGCALSTKWLALGVVGIVCFFYLLHRRYISFFVMPIIALLVYVGVFYFFFSFFYAHNAPIDKTLFTPIPALSELTFPKDGSLSEFTSSFFVMHHVMLVANNDPYVLKTILHAPQPYSWAIARSGINFWTGSNSKTVLLQGNSLLYVVSLFLFLFEIGWITHGLFTTHKLPIDRNELLLVIGYVANYLPFFFIHRAMYLYHYFAALLFLFLLVPKVAPRAIDCLAKLSQDRLFAYTFAWATLLLIIINFFLIAPTTYGF